VYPIRVPVVPASIVATRWDCLQGLASGRDRKRADFKRGYDEDLRL